MKNKKKLGLTTLIFIALIAGAITGIIINCAGLTNIEECENDISKAYKVNALGARNLSIIARKLEAKLVHIS